MVTTTTSNIGPIGKPFLTRPITNGQSHLLRILFESIRHHVVKSQPGGKGAISHRIGQQYKNLLDITESAAQQGSLSSDSSDES